MGQRQMFKQMVEFNQTVFNNFFQVLVFFQGQFERIANSASDQENWCPCFFSCFVCSDNDAKKKTLAFKYEIEDPARSILIVEDYELLLNMLSEAFAGPDWQVLKANNGLSGWELFQRNPVDIVLTDIQMPGLSGIELAHRIRKQSPKTIIALMSGENSDVACNLVTNGIIDFFFQKPFSLSLVPKLITNKMQTAELTS